MNRVQVRTDRLHTYPSSMCRCVLTQRGLSAPNTELRVQVSLLQSRL